MAKEIQLWDADGNAVYPTNAYDYIVDQGTSGIWTYRKWNSGIAECWGTSVQAITGVSKPYIPWAGYEYDFGSISFPTGLFIEAPTIAVSGRVGSNYNVVGYSNSYIANVAVSLTSNADVSGNKYAYIMARGKWK